MGLSLAQSCSLDRRGTLGRELQVETRVASVCPLFLKVVAKDISLAGLPVEALNTRLVCSWAASHKALKEQKAPIGTPIRLS